MERAARTASGLASERFSRISTIEFHMSYYRQGINQVLMTRTLNFNPSDYIAFHMKYMHDGCMYEGYDFAPVVTAMVKGRKESTSGKIFCHRTNDTLDHASIAYKVSIQYS